MSDLSDDAIRAYAANLFDLEDARETAQTDIKDAWSHIRGAHGKRFADSLKLAVKRARMDYEKRQAVDEIDAEAERIMGILASRAPRATRTREIIEEFDPETGEINERSGGALDARLPPKQEVAGSNPAQTANQPQAGDGNARPVPAQTGGVISAPATVTGPVAVESPAMNPAGHFISAFTIGRTEPVTDPTAAPLPAEVTVAGDDRSAVSPPSAATVVAFRTHNPETHFLNSKGLQRLHGCLNADVCAGSRSKLCFTCSTQHEGPAHVGGAA